MEHLPEEFEEVLRDFPDVEYTATPFASMHSFHLDKHAFHVGYDLIGDPDFSDFYTGDPSLFKWWTSEGTSGTGTDHEIAEDMRAFFDAYGMTPLAVKPDWRIS